jgi:hypothetical protein
MGVLRSVNISYVGLNFLLYHDDNFDFDFLFYATIESLMREINYWLLPSYLPEMIRDFKVRRTRLIQLILFFMIDLWPRRCWSSCFSWHSKIEHCSGRGLNTNSSSCPFIVNLISPFPTSMCALAVLKKGLLRMSDTFESGCMSSTTKSTGTKNSLILIGMFSAIPNGYQTDWSTSCKHIGVGSSAE